jgi:endonuclease/exonuclease/phosphatase family metal-dependent hydrolase
MANTTRLSLVTLLAFLAAVAGVFPASAQTPVADETGSQGIRVMSYNIKHARGNDDCVNPTAVPDTIPEAECEIDIERVAGVIEESGASIIGLQEVDRFWARSGGVDQPEELASMLGMNVCYGANLDHPADEHGDVPHQYGTAVLSAFPIVDCNNTFLETPEGWEQRGALSATIDLGNGQAIQVLNTHLQAGREGEEAEAQRQRTEQLGGLLNIASESDLPVVIMGDLNATPESDDLAAIANDTSGFTDAWVAATGDQDGFTSSASPDEDPRARIDYIWVDSSFAVVSAEVIVSDVTRLAADHYPVIAAVELIAQDDATPVATPVA